jgi:DNA mismatch repair ATPase MutL
MEQRTLLYDERFLESYAGAIITDPATAVVELVANCWDAYATEVKITWPDVELQRQFKISDNGQGG